VIERVLLHFGKEPPADTASTVTTWIAANPPDRYGRHRYTLDQYGLRGGARALRGLHESLRPRARGRACSVRLTLRVREISTPPDPASLVLRRLELDPHHVREYWHASTAVATVRDALS
jgi:hypothetical protein